MRYAQIIGTGAYLPEIEITNDMLREQLAHVPGFVDKMEANTSIRKRWYAPDDWATSDLALKAARRLWPTRDASRGCRPDHSGHRLARLHYTRHFGGSAAQAGRKERGNL